MAAVTAASELDKVLERRPEARPFSVESLVQDVRDGRVRVPAFQRPLLWNVDDARELLDSIYRGYPIGTLLFWQRYGPAQRLEYGTFVVDAPVLSEALWVVDGQQRIHSLVRTLAGAGYPKETFALYFDLEKATFVSPRRAGDVRSTWIPLTEIVDSERLLTWILDHPNIDRKLAIRVGKRVREYQIPAYLVRTDDEDAVREIFSRLNRRGKQMEDHDVFTALYGAKRQSSPSDVRDVARDLADEKIGFGDVPTKLLHSMMLATLGTDVSKNRVPKLSDEAARAAIESLGRSARSVIHFLQHDAAIPHIALLPYTLPLVTLTRFFHFHPEIHPRSRELLARWVWRGAQSGQHQGNTISVRKTLEAVVEGDEHGSVQRLLGTLKHANAGAFPLDKFRFRDARAKILTLALWSLAPRSVVTGEPIEVLEEGLFPPAIITSSLDEGHLANRMIHPPLEAGSRAIRQALFDVHNLRDASHILKSHALDERCIELLRLKDYDTFMQLRSSILTEHVNRFVQARARFGENTRPPILALVIDDEEEEEDHDDGA